MWDLLENFDLDFPETDNLESSGPDLSMPEDLDGPDGEPLETSDSDFPETDTDLDSW